MTPAQIPFTKTATIHKSEKFICIEALSGASAMKYREDESYRVYLEPDATDEALGQVLLAAFDRSRFIDPSNRESYAQGRPTRALANWQKDFMARYGYKTKREAFKNLDWCYATMPDGKICIRPNRRDKPGAWGGLPADRTVVIPATRDAAVVGAALRLALSRCE